MNAITDAASAVTLGGVGTWAILVTMLLAWWRGLPKFIPMVIQAITERNAKLAEGFDFQIQRLEAQLGASDERHRECVAAQDALRRELTELSDKYDVMRRQWVQQQSSTVAVLPGSMVSRDIQEATRRGDVIRGDRDD